MIKNKTIYNTLLVFFLNKNQSQTGIQGYILTR